MNAMLRRVLNVLEGPRGGTRLASVPEGTCVYAIGDVHGRVDLLRTLLFAIDRDSAARRPERVMVVFLGDYVDRGLQSRAVLDLLVCDPPRAFEYRFLKGNHEQALLNFLDNPGFGLVWRNFGGLETLASYGIVPPLGLADEAWFREAAAQLARALPEEHLAFLKGLELSATVGSYFFAHAGVKPGVPLERQSEQDLLWIREEFLSSTANHGKIIVHGHSPVDAPEMRRNRIGIDTGAYITGRLTALALQGTERAFLSS